MEDREQTGASGAGAANGEAGDVGEPWDFAGRGRAARITNLPPVTGPLSRLDQSVKHKLGTWQATAICGNDITSSCLYVSALCAAQAGVLAPLVLLIVAGVLYLFRKVYAEVGSALPLNGGTYTVLLNTTNKRTAAAAACLTLLSYVATAVISANEAMHYAHNLLPALDVGSATVALLGLFAFLGIVGISESAAVALGIFVLHMATLAILSLSGLWVVLNDPSLLIANWHLPNGDGVFHALVFGFAAAMLGISGFESSANFIEEQKKGVFPKTLRNMWIAVAVFNPLISLLSLGLMPLAEIQQVPPDLLARMGELSLGHWLHIWVSLDAVAVLSGAVLTSYVGVTGLVRRMSLDRCLPQCLLRENPWRKTNHWIILGFFLLCVSILGVTGGRIEILAGVYTLAFLCVMALFAIGNILLKSRRSRLPRATRASLPTVIAALAAVLVGIVGNVALDPANVRVFLIYYGVALLVVALMFTRIRLMKGLLFISKAAVERLRAANDALREPIVRSIDEINRRSVIYFADERDDISILNRAALYVLENEQSNRMMIVHVYDHEDNIPGHFASNLETIDRLYPQLRVDFLAVRGEFGPQIIEALSRKLKVPKNYMFIGTPGDHFPHRVEELGGVRLIL